MTSKIHACLFTKEACLPCTVTKDYLSSLVREENDFANQVSILQKENHSALVAAYELEKYPTLLLVDNHGEELARLVGGKKVREYLPGILRTLQIINHHEISC